MISTVVVLVHARTNAEVLKVGDKFARDLIFRHLFHQQLCAVSGFLFRHTNFALFRDTSGFSFLNSSLPNEASRSNNSDGFR